MHGHCSNVCSLCTLWECRVMFFPWVKESWGDEDQSSLLNDLMSIVYRNHPRGVKLSRYWNKKLTSLIQALMKNIHLWAYIRTKSCCVKMRIYFIRCRFGRVEACKVLINIGKCSPNAITDVDCWTPMHHAALNGQRYVVEFLLSLDNIDVVCM